MEDDTGIIQCRYPFLTKGYIFLYYIRPGRISGYFTVNIDPE